MLVASSVQWTDGRAHPMNTPRPKPFAAQGRATGGCGRAAAFLSARRRSCRSWSRLSSVGGAGCRRPTSSCGTTISSSRPGCCAALPGCSARPASSCTRPRPSARQTSIRGTGSSTRSGTRSGRSGPIRSALPERALYGARHAAPVGAHLRPLGRPAHASLVTGPRCRRRPAHAPAVERAGAGGRHGAERCARLTQTGPPDRRPAAGFHRPRSARQPFVPARERPRPPDRSPSLRDWLAGPYQTWSVGLLRANV